MSLAFDNIIVKHIYIDHAYNEMTLITKRLWIAGNHYISFIKFLH